MPKRDTWPEELYPIYYLAELGPGTLNWCVLEFTDEEIVDYEATMKNFYRWQSVISERFEADRKKIAEEDKE